MVHKMQRLNRVCSRN